MSVQESHVMTAILFQGMDVVPHARLRLTSYAQTLQISHLYANTISALS
jgi:hypothetical protein